MSCILITAISHVHFLGLIAILRIGERKRQTYQSLLKVSQTMTMKNETIKQIETMIELQNGFNQKVFINWREKHLPWHRAIRAEAIEAMDHYGWKWWKKQELNTAQLKLEIVDIWHFIISEAIQYRGDDAISFIYAQYLNVQQFKNEVADDGFYSDETIRNHLDFLVTADSFYTRLKGFLYCMFSLSMTMEDVYKLYLSKNTLNQFRQDHGYKDGTYLKTWNGQEDNEYLFSYIGTVDANIDPQDYQDHIYHKLESDYLSVKESMFVAPVAVQEFIDTESIAEYAQSILLHVKDSDASHVKHFVNQILAHCGREAVA
jgi:dimeric dUTPase (all-alpha-NTP-PPase superfamily)